MQALSSSNPNSVSRSVSQLIIHPNYSSSTNDNDIALLRLNSSVNFTNYITPVCLAAAGSTFFNGTLTWVTGWGNTATGGCSLYTHGYLIGLAQGDSGSPLVSKQGVWIQAGIASFGVGCAQANYPGVYTRVSQYQAWVDQQITSNQPGFVTFTSTETDGDLNVSCAGLPTVATTTTTTASSVVCGSAKLNAVTGGGNSLASVGAWPWMASLQRNGTHVCGGTLVAEQFVLSSADCFSSSTNASDWTVILGRLKQNGSNINEVSTNIGGPLMCKVDQSWVQPAVLTLATKLSRVSDVQVFTKTSSFSKFLQTVVGTFPFKANTTSTNNTTIKPVSSSATRSSTFLSVTSLLLLLLLLPALTQMFS
ncbi:hypothetical protein MHYP_G00152060 [Metynnis hypsauchen]